MNPRYRRLLIPGLLIVLIVIVLITSLARESRGAVPEPEHPRSGDKVVSTITDPAVTESSGLVLSLKDPDLAYTVNDSGNDPVVFAIKVSTGKVVGTTRLADPWTDAEALSIDDTGRLWIADTGDNARARDSAILYALDEPGPGDHRAKAETFPLTFPEGPADVETLLINPKTNAKFLVSKDFGGGTVYAIPEDLKPSADNQVSAVGKVAPLLTDGAFTPDAKSVLLRDYGTVRVYDAKTWKQRSITKLPEQKQGETLAVEPDGKSVLIGSEGKDSELIRVSVVVDAAGPADAPDEPATDDDGSSLMGTTWLILAFVLVAGVGIFVVRRRR